MNTTPWVAQPADESLVRVLRDYFELTKPRIGLMVLVTVAASAYLAAWSQPDPWVLLSALVGTGCVAASASVMNHLLERDVDLKMPRTHDRPLPTGRVSTWEALALAGLLGIVGFATLALGTTGATTILSLMAWVSYVMIYTPLKRVTTWNTLVGAVPGALPMLMGWTATGAALDVRAWSLFFIVFFWQFPHFMAIAWRYRRDYAAAGIRMLPVMEPTGQRAGIQAVLGALALVPTSVLPAILGARTLGLSLLIPLGSLWFLGLAWDFYKERNDITSRKLLRGSLIYLPVLMLVLCGLPWFSWRT